MLNDATQNLRIIETVMCPILPSIRSSNIPVFFGAGRKMQAQRRKINPKYGLKNNEEPALSETTALRLAGTRSRLKSEWLFIRVEVRTFAAVAQNGGAEEDRTPDLHVANVALYQLSYRPSEKRKYIDAPTG